MATIPDSDAEGAAERALSQAALARQLDAALAELPEVCAWRDRLVAMYGGMGDRFGLYPARRSGPDGR